MGVYDECAGCANYGTTCNEKLTKHKCPARVFKCDVCIHKLECGLCPYYGCKLYEPSKWAWRLQKIKLFLRKRI